MKFSRLIVALFLIGLFARPVHAGEAEDQITNLLQDQASAWNAGDIPAFMEAYWKSGELRFASGGTITYGWQETLENYQRTYATPEKMGKLKFSKLDINVLSENYALVFGRWDLDREGGDLGGLFTLLFEKRPEGWRIVADHTSSDDLPVAVISE